MPRFLPSQGRNASLGLLWPTLRASPSNVSHQTFPYRLRPCGLSTFPSVIALGRAFQLRGHATCVRRFAASGSFVEIDVDALKPFGPSSASLRDLPPRLHQPFSISITRKASFVAAVVNHVPPQRITSNNRRGINFPSPSSAKFFRCSRRETRGPSTNHLQQQARDQLSTIQLPATFRLQLSHLTPATARFARSLPSHCRTHLARHASKPCCNDLPLYGRYSASFLFQFICEPSSRRIRVWHFSTLLKSRLPLCLLPMFPLFLRTAVSRLTVCTVSNFLETSPGHRGQGPVCRALTRWES